MIISTAIYIIIRSEASLSVAIIKKGFPVDSSGQPEALCCTAGAYTTRSCGVSQPVRRLAL